MRTMTVRGDSSPRTDELTENAYIIRKGIQPFEDTQEDGTVSQGYTWTEVRLEREEYLAVREGRLPPGAAWTTDLRRIERGALLDRADVLLAEAEDHIAADGDSAWTAYRSAVHSYKLAVRDTINQATFPAEVVYPAVPVQPE